MALNYSHGPAFPAFISEDNLVSPVRIVDGHLVDDIPDKNGEVYLRLWHMNQGQADNRRFICGRDKADLCSSPESTSKDIVDLLPPDPFEMDIQATITVITEWLEDLELDYGEYMRTNTCRASQEGHGLFTGWDMICNNSLKFQPLPNTIQLNKKLNMESSPRNVRVCGKPSVGKNHVPHGIQFDDKLKSASTVEDTSMGVGLAPFDIGFQPCHNLGDIVGFSNGNASCNPELESREKERGAANLGVPHEALDFTLRYLGVKDLLSIERVCRSLFSTVRGDPLLWMTIHIDQPLNERITDDVLVQLTDRAQGNLQCLNLVECPKITGDGLRQILETNARITKLCVPGCTRISIECIVNSIKAYNSNKTVGGIKHLRIGGLYGVNRQHFEELEFLLGADQRKLGPYHRPHFYHRGNLYLPCDDDRAIDIEMCLRCEKFRLVYDCPAEGCKVKDESSQICRACIHCIARCAQCGRCINNIEFEETFCLELLCSDCFKQPPQLPRQSG